MEHLQPGQNLILSKLGVRPDEQKVAIVHSQDGQTRHIPVDILTLRPDGTAHLFIRAGDTEELIPTRVSRRFALVSLPGEGNKQTYGPQFITSVVSHEVMLMSAVTRLHRALLEQDSPIVERDDLEKGGVMTPSEAIDNLLLLKEEIRRGRYRLKWENPFNTTHETVYENGTMSS